MSGVNPQGVRVHGFKVPSAEELDHDYLWRYAQRLPARGEIGIFNRSHYEEVLVVRVHPEILDRQQLPAAARTTGVWKRRYREINDWERYLDRQRVPDREALPEPLQGGAAQRASSADRPARAELEVLGRRRQRARALGRLPARVLARCCRHTSTEWAPWYVIPADRKWFARICAAAVLAHTLMEIDPQYPDGQRASAAGAGRVKAASSRPRRPRAPRPTPSPRATTESTPTAGRRRPTS